MVHITSYIIPSGDIIISQGDDGDNFYLVDEGAVDVFIGNIGSIEDAKCVKTCEKGDSFGELAIMYNAPRAVSRAVLVYVYCMLVVS